MKKGQKRGSTYFPKEARKQVAEQAVFPTPLTACQNGDCVVGALLRAVYPNEPDSFPREYRRPGPHQAAELLFSWGVTAKPEDNNKCWQVEVDLSYLMTMNDDGDLGTPEAVKTVLGV